MSGGFIKSTAKVKQFIAKDKCLEEDTGHIQIANIKWLCYSHFFIDKY